MLSFIQENLFLVVVVGVAVALAILWFAIIAPLEKRNHERKLAALQQRIKNHEENLAGGGAGESADPANPS